MHTASKDLNPIASRLRLAAQSVARILGPVLEGLARLEAQRPANWPDLLSYVRVQPLIADGFPVLWVPDADTLFAMLAAHDRTTRQQVLVERQNRILVDANSVLREVCSPDLAQARELLEQAVGCVDRFPGPAQALTLQVATVVAQREVGVDSLSALAKEAREKSAALASARHGDLVVDLRGSLMLLAIAPVLVRFDATRDPVPTHPSRHAVSHVIDAAQYTAGNALESVLLAVRVLLQAEAARSSRSTPAEVDTIAAVYRSTLPAGTN